MNVEQKERRNQANIRAIYDFTMGVLWTAAGLFFIFYEKLGFDHLDFDPFLAAIFGGTCVLYAFFRFYRGYKARKTL